VIAEVTVDWMPAGTTSTAARFVFTAEPGAPIVAGSYTAPLAGLTLVRNDHQCDVFAGSTGRFEIVDFEYSLTTVTRFVATFERTCNATPGATVRGCVVYAAP